MCYRGKLGPLGISSESSNYVVVPIECKYCKVYEGSLTDCKVFLSENVRMKDMTIVTESDYVKFWNDRFYN